MSLCVDGLEYTMSVSPLVLSAVGASSRPRGAFVIRDSEPVSAARAAT
jgi:hypothetical protein